MSEHAIRAYLTRLRERQDISQQKLAETIGVSRLTWNYYETGRREDGLKSALLFAALRELRGSFDHLRELASQDATEDQAVILAEERIAELESGNARDALKALKSTLSAAEFRQYVRSLKENARIQQELLDELGTDS